MISYGQVDDKTKWQHFVELVNRRLPLTIVLIVIMLLSLLFESFGFAMILPLLESVIGVKTDTLLGGQLNQLFEIVGIEASLINISIAFFLVILIKNVMIVARDGLRTYYAYTYRKEAMLAINRSLMTMDYEDFQQERQGHILNDTITATQHATLFLIQFIEFVTSIFAIIIFTVVMYMAEPVVTIGMMVFGVLFFLFSKLSLGRYGKKVGMKEVHLNQSITDFFSESVILMRDFRLNLLERFQLQRMKDKLEQFVRMEVKWNALTAAIYPFVELMIVLVFCIYVLYLSSFDSTEGIKEKLPALGVLVLLGQRMFVRVSQITRTHVSIVRYFESFAVVSSYFDVHFEKSGESRELDFTRDIVFDSVTVGRGKNEHVINNTSFTFQGGKVTGLVGESGSGKSTLLDLIVRLRKLESGKVVIGESDLNNIDLDLLRERVGVVSQRVSLRNASVIDNIRMGNLLASDEEIFTLSERLGVHDFILSLPDGYNTVVGDGGGLLSGGQAQRIIIARALLRDPDILILDEFTSALDVETEENIVAKVIELMDGKTIIIAGHRVSALKYCDQVFSVKDKGVVLV